MAVAAKKPEATLCLLTALSPHELTDEIPTRSDIAIPRGTQPVTVRHAPISWHRFGASTFGIGRTDQGLPGKMPIDVYSAERTLIDRFRLRHTWGSGRAGRLTGRTIDKDPAAPVSATGGETVAERSSERLRVASGGDATTAFRSLPTCPR